jgi:hypothetical protein
MGLLCAAALSLGAWSVREAYAACTVNFDLAIPEWQATVDGHSFGTEQMPQPLVRVDYNSSGQTGGWMLYGSETPGNSVHLSVQSHTPNYRSIGAEDDDFTTFTITGALDTSGEDGLYQLSCWDGTFWACSGSHDITILR